MVVDLFRSRKSLEAEVVALRHQLNVLLRRSGHKRPALSRFDRLVFVGLYRFVPSVLDAVTIVRPETIMRWHRAGFRAFWHWKSRAKRAGSVSATPYRLHGSRREMFSWCLRKERSRVVRYRSRPTKRIAAIRANSAKS